jgi:hypothetical protein
LVGGWGQHLPGFGAEYASMEGAFHFCPANVSLGQGGEGVGAYLIDGMVLSIEVNQQNALISQFNKLHLSRR